MLLVTPRRAGSSAVARRSLAGTGRHRPPAASVAWTNLALQVVPRLYERTAHLEKRH